MEKQRVLHSLGVCVLALVIQHEMRMRHIVICALHCSAIIFYIISYKVRFSEKRYWAQNVCLDFLYKFYLHYLSFQEEMSEIR